MNKIHINRNWGIILIVYVLIMISISGIAYLSLLPDCMGLIPYFDKAMHFLFVGGLFFVSHKALNRAMVSIWRINIPVAFFMAFLFTTVEEGLQGISTVRNLSLADFIASVSGLTIFWILDSIITKNKKK